MKDKGLLIYSQLSPTKLIHKLMLTSDIVWVKCSPTTTKKKIKKRKNKGKAEGGVILFGVFKKFECIELLAETMSFLLCSAELSFVVRNDGGR